MILDARDGVGQILAGSTIVRLYRDGDWLDVTNRCAWVDPEAGIGFLYDLAEGRKCVMENGEVAGSEVRGTYEVTVRPEAPHHVLRLAGELGLEVLQLTMGPGE